MSAQGHWGIEEGDAGPSRGHVHTELDLDSIPNPAKGIIRLTPRLVFFHNPGICREIDVRGASFSGAVREGFQDFNIKTPQDIPATPLRGDEHGEIAYDYPLDIDTRIYPYD